MPSPLAQAMIVCDAVHRDQSTGKYFLLGTFSTIFTRQLPCRHRQMCLFVAMTECRGPTPITVKLIRIDPEGGQDVVITQAQGEIQARDPLQVHEVVLPLRNVQFEHSGEYRFQLESAGELLLEKRLVVALQKPAGA
ncbi:MAG: DUF6941 family protein [Planctomycetota bacterium]|jgi:hypothetical protein